MSVNWDYVKIIDNHMPEMIKIDSDNTKKIRENGGIEWLWSTTDLAMRIIHQLKVETDSTGIVFDKYAYWVSLKLKLTNDYIRGIILDYYKNGVDYNQEVYGQRIYDVMRKRGLCYIEAILHIYEDCDEVNNPFYDKDHPWRYGFIDSRYRGNKIRYSRLLDDGTIEYYPPNDEYKISNFLTDTTTQEEWDRIIAQARKYNNE